MGRLLKLNKLLFYRPLRDQSFVKSRPPIESLILMIRGERVILAADLAVIYGVETRALPQAVKRNAERFPQTSPSNLDPRSLPN